MRFQGPLDAPSCVSAAAARVRWLLLGVLLLSVLLAACGGSTASPNEGADAAPTATSAATAFLAPPVEIAPVVFPDDEAPHDNLTEWWYYTGHLFTADGSRYGFEYVIFQAQRGSFPPVFAAHLALTDSANQRFVYDQRIGQNTAPAAASGFALALGDWQMAGLDGSDVLSATMTDGSVGIDLTLEGEKEAVLHNGIGYVDFGPAGGSYYYSRTRIAVEGTVLLDGREQEVTGEAWFDHQWGDFISVGAGGWDWFSVQLADGDDLTISLVRDEDAAITIAYGTYVAADGTVTHLETDDIDVRATETWTSPHTGAVYPSRWTVNVPTQNLTLDVVPTMHDQELDTSASTFVIYWEGEVTAVGTRAGAPVEGLGYVELTGYDRGLNPMPGAADADAPGASPTP